MRKLFLVILSIAGLCSCQQKHEIGEYFYVNIRPNNIPVAHIDKECDDKTVIVAASKVYENKAEGGYIFFCSKCTTDEQMKQIEDSVAKRQRENRHNNY